MWLISLIRTDERKWLNDRQKSLWSVDPGTFKNLWVYIRSQKTCNDTGRKRTEKLSICVRVNVRHRQRRLWPVIWPVIEHKCLYNETRDWSQMDSNGQKRLSVSTSGLHQIELQTDVTNPLCGSERDTGQKFQLTIYQYEIV